MPNFAPAKLRHTLVEAASRRVNTLLLTILLVMAAVALLTYLMPRRYRADAKLAVQNVRSDAALSTSPTDRQVQNNDVSTTEVNSEADLLQSTAVARRALGAAADAPETETEDRAVRKLEGRLTVEPVHQTNLIDVKLLGDSPAAAQQQLNALLNAYFDERARAARSGGAAEFFDRQVQDKSGALDADQQALTAFEVQHGIADLDDEKKLQVERVAGIEDQLRAAEASIAAQSSKTAAERRQLAGTLPRSRTVERSITNQYSQERLNTSLVDLENRLSELRKRYPPTDRQVQEVEEKIATTQRAIADARNQPAGETATDVNPVWQTLSASVAASSGELSGLEAQRTELQRQRGQAQARLTELEQATGTYDSLKRKLGQSQADYTLYAQKRDEARVSEALDRERMFDVALLEPPTASPEPVRPRPALYLAAGLVFAVGLGLLLALYRDTSSETVYTPAQLDAQTGTRSLAVFADLDDADAHQEGNRLEFRRLLFALRSALGVTEPAEGQPARGYCVAFTSALAGEGVTYMAGHLAREAAQQASSKVALLGAEALLRHFEAEGTVSFALQYDESLRYWLLAPSGEAGAAPLRHGGTQGMFSTRLRPLLEQARAEFDLLLLDCPSLAESTLAGELAPCVDGYVAVVRAGRARKTGLETLRATLGDSGAPLLGYVLNARRYPVPGWLHRLLW